HAARARLAALRDEDGRALARAEFARYALGEIDAARVEGDDEDARLRERRDLLSNAERIASALGIAAAALEDDAGAVDALGAAETALLGVARYGERFGDLAGAASALQSEANELAARIARERDAIELDPAELDAVVARLDALDALKKKYGGTLAAVREQREAFAAQVADVDDRDARVAAAERDAAAHGAALAAEARALTARRAEAAAAIERAVAGELAAMAMPAARLRVALEPLDETGPRGADRAELRFAANPGEAERPLARVASGGAVARSPRARRGSGRPARAERAPVRRDRRRHRRCDRRGGRRTPCASRGKRASRLRHAPPADRLARRRARRASQERRSRRDDDRGGRGRRRRATCGDRADALRRGRRRRAGARRGASRRARGESPASRCLTPA